MNELKQNALLNSMHRSLRVALQGRVNSAKRFLRKRFRVNKLNLKTIVVLCFLYAIY
ncbi:hypothetical protein MAL08_17730 [Leptospira noguchii]|uniref:hypothetical protein n=1 Tax=Leptospira noguchii TaxID=28182 RepID=UPI00031646EA|nr:hypothetical protein [Leptospira noguchii]UOG38436.1 hypothetical protein MAL08_03650 [Leptospira noguchii]UOG39774.1 hypothetical protein MAL08_17730 [Leptospira noguchii]UOG49430.1 hypothetical protein MAL00_03875 [Leptospira noguchii]